MAGTLRHRLVRPDLLPYGPVSIRLTPTGDIDIILDNTKIDPILLATMDGLGTGILNVIDPLDVPLITPQTIAQVHAVSDVGGGRLVAVEFDKGQIHGLIDKTLVKPEVLPVYGEHVTRILQRFTPPTL